MSQTLVIQRDPVGVVTLQFNRPAKRNAFDDEMMDELLNTLMVLQKDHDLRVLVLTGIGPYFCGGVDTPWFSEVVSGGMEELESVTRKHVLLLHTLYDFPKPTVARVQGPAHAMGVGVIACCDIAFCSQNAQFSFPEIRAGTVPAPASPYLVQAIGARHALRYFMSGETMSPIKALHLGLVHECLPDEAALDEAIKTLVNALLLGGPEAQNTCKRLVNNITGVQQRLDRLDAYTASTLAHLYVVAEAVDGTTAYFKKRPPPWFRGKYG